MTPLENYLRGTFKEDGIFLNRLLETIEEVIPIFYKQTHKELAKQNITSWSYAVSLTGENPKVLQQIGEQFSASTHCMILFALEALTPRNKEQYSILLGKHFKPCSLSDKVVNRQILQELILNAKKSLIEKLKGSRGSDYLVQSSTYGKNDPFTLTWLAELAFRWSQESDETTSDSDECREQINQAALQALNRKTILETEKAFKEVTSSFLKVRRLHLAKAAERIIGKERFSSEAKKWRDNSALWQEFDSTIYRQLSYWSIGDPRFDAAELAFSFEGALLIHPTWVSRSTIEKVFEALKLSQDPRPYWRPISPFLANHQGHVLFLISIEVANSILRACEILDEEDALLGWFSQFEPQLRNYAAWLFGEMEEIADPNSPNEPSLVGWRTEYDDNRDTIKLWHTSHVLIFLSHYASLLKRKMASDGIEAAGLQIRAPKLIEGYWKEDPIQSLAKNSDQPYAVLKRIKKQYIEPREVDKKNGGEAKIPNDNSDEVKTPLYSMLLYGPPGTGKTTVAEQIAATLKRPLIIITVSDFLAAGATEIENRAKGIFEILRAQGDIVILFDEIDQFLLDRNSDFYQKQDDVFKFMTPGMLTKLQDLRDAENCIFIIATNYFERIDSAIKRRGRIDQHFLLSVPDQEQRLEIIKRFTRKIFDKEFEDKKKKEEYLQAANDTTKLDFFNFVSGGECDSQAAQANKIRFKDALENAHHLGNISKNVLKETVLFGFGDLKNLVESKVKIKAGMDFNSFADALAVVTFSGDAAINLSAYRSRFGDDKNPSPFEEFFLLLYLCQECEKELKDSEKETIRRALCRLSDENWDNLNQPPTEEDFDVRLNDYIVEVAIRDKVREYIKKALTET